MIRNRACFVAAAWLLLLAAHPASGQNAPRLQTDVRSVPGEIVVGFHPEAALEDLDSIAVSFGLQLIDRVERLGIGLLQDAGQRAIEDVCGELASLPEIRFAHPNWVGSGGFIPSDTHFDKQWHHENTGQSGGTPGADIETVAAWDMTRGSASIVLAILDTGIDSDNADFVGRILPGFDFVNEDADPEADHSHGPLVTGLAAASADNAFGVAGVDHFCSILPVKVLDQFNFGTVFDLIQGLDFASTAGADVVSMSLINYPDSGGLRLALERARQDGSILIACAGNGGIGNADVSWPGASPHTISIGATDHRDQRASFSGTGNALDFVAPGEEVATTRWWPLDGFALFTGCSAATPIAAGLASLCLSLDPTLSQDQLFELFACGAEDQVGRAFEDRPGWDRFYGWGRVNTRRTLLALQLFRIDSLAPSRGSFQGGDTILLSGAGFTPATSVLIGDAPATSVIFLGPNLLQVTVPQRPLPDLDPAAPGPLQSQLLGERVDVVVLDHGCQRTAEEAFLYVAR